MNWPCDFEKLATPRATVTHLLSRDRAIRHALWVQAQRDAIRCSINRNGYGEAFFTNKADFTGLSSFTAEASLLAGQKQQPILPAGFLAGADGIGKSFSFYAAGIIGTTGTPTFTFTTRIGSTAGDSDLTGAAVGVSAAIVTASGVSNKTWSLELHLTCTVAGIGANNCTLSGYGWVDSPGGFASPFKYALSPTTPDTATWTQTINGAVQNYFNLSVACQTSNASNAITCKFLKAISWN